MNSRSTVLYVNDNPKSLRLLAGILEDCGFEVKTAAAPWAAIELVHHHPYALALLNYQMPDMTGAQLAQELRGMDPSLPIVLMSGSEALPAGELAYVDAHIGRGASIEDLTHLIGELMETERPERHFDTALHKSAAGAPGWR
jgi:two-component system nitrogen regulation response regulator NtrX